MLFSEVMPFEEALQSREVKVLLPTELSSRELEAIRPEIRERSLFAARVANTEFLQEFDDLAREIVSGNLDYATARLRLKEYNQRTGYRAEPGEEGTIKDLNSDKRLNLILEMNAKMSQGYGGFIQGQNPAVLDEWPAQELYRAEERKEKREWPVTWLSAAAEVGDEAAGSALRNHGRMAARKDSRIWVNLGPFKLPYSPFDWGSGMAERDVNRESAIALGLLKPGDQVEPQTRGFNDDLESRPEIRSERLKRAVLEDLGEDYFWDGEVLKRRSSQKRTKETEDDLAGRATRAEGPQRRDDNPKRKRVAESPVSAALQVVRRMPRSLEEMKQMIDRIHDDGKLPRIQVDGRTDPKNFGEYRYWRDGTPQGIGIKNRDGDELTFAHEVGHFLDHQVLGNKGIYASERHPALETWRAVVEQSELIRTLKRRHKESQNTRNREYLRYLLELREIWARAYSQWIAREILRRGLGTEQMRARVKAELEHRQTDPMRGHWKDDDFEPIAVEIERMLEGKGWLLAE